jgi:ribonuclease BN (tRNA processing enzyme)
MRIIFLGTNGWYDTKTGNTLSVLVETRKEYVVLDAGNGIYKLDRYIKGLKPIHIFLSHLHLDHIIGLHLFAKFNFPQGIDIYAPRHLSRRLASVIRKPYSAALTHLRTKVRLRELGKNYPAPIKVKWRRLLHSSMCYGYRFTLENKIVSFCTDTGLCTNILLLSDKADLLIAECSFKSGQESKKWPHLNPEEAARIADEAGVKRLALVHFDAGLYTSLSERKIAQKKAQEIFKNTFAAQDDQEIIL